MMDETSFNEAVAEGHFNEVLANDNLEQLDSNISDKLKVSFESAAVLQALVAVQSDSKNNLPSEIKQALVTTAASGMGLDPHSVIGTDGKVKPILTMLESTDNLRAVFDASLANIDALLNDVDRMINLVYPKYTRALVELQRRVGILDKRVWEADGHWENVPLNFSYLAAGSETVRNAGVILNHIAKIGNHTANILGLDQGLVVVFEALLRNDTDLDKIKGHLQKQYLRYAKDGYFTETDGDYVAPAKVAVNQLVLYGMDSGIIDTYASIRAIGLKELGIFPVLAKADLQPALVTLCQVFVDTLFRYRAAKIPNVVSLARQQLDAFAENTQVIDDEVLERLSLYRNTVLSALIVPVRYLRALEITIAAYNNYLYDYLILDYSEVE